MRRVTAQKAILLAGLITALAAPPVLANDRAIWNTASTAITVGLVGATGVETLSYGDGKGQTQLFKTLGVAFLATEVLKHAVHETRPDGSGTNSFPSGQTAFAFAAATYFDIRYGDEHPGLVPVMYGLAGLTAVARVAARRHYAQDVVAGGAIGALSAAAFTSPYMRAVNVYPTRDGLGVSYTQKF